MKLPPLKALRAFDAAGRHQSFLLAAKELHVSAASVSRFIKLLEVDLGKKLFFRNANGVELTEIGEQYLMAVQPALQNIATVTNDFRQRQAKQRLKIVTIPAVAETWLVSRLWSFQQLHDDIQINLVLDDSPPIFQANEATIWINYSASSYQDMNCFAMSKDQLTLVCSPDIAESLQNPKDILNYPLLIDIDWQDDWKTWLQAANLDIDITEEYIHFERYSMVVNAALAGLGVAIGHTALLASYLSMGTLVAPFNILANTKKQFYAITACNTQRNSVKQFIQWFIKNK